MPGADGGRRVRVVVGGQVPPPMSGQHVAVARILARLGQDQRVDAEHLPYRFAGTMTDQGRITPAKVLALLRQVVQVLALRRRAPVDVYLHPISGPATAAAIKDAVLLLAARLVSHVVVAQFHGGGHALAWRDRTPVQAVVARILGTADVAVVHAEVHRRDPASLGIPRVEVVPHRIPDRCRPELRPTPRPDAVQILYVGHLGPHRGTPELVAAVTRLHEGGLPVHLVLVGQPAQGWTRTDLDRLLAEAPDGLVEHHGQRAGAALDATFAAADVFAFPSRFVAETFGLVLVEALMWGLPVVATDWGAARDLLAGDDLDVVVHPLEPFLEEQLVAGLGAMVEALAEGRVTCPSPANRRHYERRFRDDVDPLADLLVSLHGGAG